MKCSIKRIHRMIPSIGSKRISQMYWRLTQARPNYEYDKYDYDYAHDTNLLLKLWVEECNKKPVSMLRNKLRDVFKNLRPYGFFYSQEYFSGPRCTSHRANDKQLTKPQIPLYFHPTSKFQRNMRCCTLNMSQLLDYSDIPFEEIFWSHFFI